MKNNQVTALELKKAIEKTVGNGYVNKAPLGSSGQTVLVYGEKERRSSISVRLHSSGVELLICNSSGNFLFYGKYHEKLGVEFISKRFEDIIHGVGYELIHSGSVKPRNYIKSIIVPIKKLLKHNQ